MFGYTWNSAIYCLSGSPECRPSQAVDLTGRLEEQNRQHDPGHYGDDREPVEDAFVLAARGAHEAKVNQPHIVRADVGALVEGNDPVVDDDRTGCQRRFQECLPARLVGHPFQHVDHEATQNAALDRHRICHALGGRRLGVLVVGEGGTEPSHQRGAGILEARRDLRCRCPTRCRLATPPPLPTRIQEVRRTCEINDSTMACRRTPAGRARASTRIGAAGKAGNRCRRSRREAAARPAPVPALP